MDKLSLLQICSVRTFCGSSDTFIQTFRHNGNNKCNVTFLSKCIHCCKLEAYKCDLYTGLTAEVGVDSDCLIRLFGQLLSVFLPLLNVFKGYFAS